MRDDLLNQKIISATPQDVRVRNSNIHQLAYPVDGTQREATICCLDDLPGYPDWSILVEGHLSPENIPHDSTIEPIGRFSR